MNFSVAEFTYIEVVLQVLVTRVINSMVNVIVGWMMFGGG